MKCSIYRGKRKEDHYVYLPEADNFEAIPDSIKRLMGEFVLVIYQCQKKPDTLCF